MRRLLILILLLSLLTACGQPPEENGNGETEETTTEQEAPAEESEEADTEETDEEETDEEDNGDTEEEEDDGDDEESGATDEDAAEEQASVDLNLEPLTDLNLRNGPGLNYLVIGNLPEGEEVPILGTNENATWYLVETAEGEAWITADPELVEVSNTDMVADLETLEDPPLPYDITVPIVNQVLNEIPMVVHHGDSVTCASHGGILHLLPEVQPDNVIGPHSGDFVLNQRNVLFRYTPSGTVLIHEDDVNRFPDGSASLPLSEAMNLFAEGDITWTGDFGMPGRNIPGCDPRVP